MTRKQRQAAQPKFVPRQWPPDPQSTYLLARAERLRLIRYHSGRETTKAQALRFAIDSTGLANPTRRHFQLGK